MSAAQFQPHAPRVQQCIDATAAPATAPPPTYREAAAAGTPNVINLARPEPPRRCWICLVDETEGAPDGAPSTLVWKKPCTCSLVAHEHCLLNWISIQESDARSDKATCPQCRQPIHTRDASPSPLLRVLETIDHEFKRVMPILVGYGMGTTIHIAACSYAFTTLEKVCGENVLRMVVKHFDNPLDRRWWHYSVGFPLVPLYLLAIESRSTTLPFLLELLAHTILPLPSLTFERLHAHPSTWPASSLVTMAGFAKTNVWDKIYVQKLVPVKERWEREARGAGEEDEGAQGGEQRWEWDLGRFGVDIQFGQEPVEEVPAVNPPAEIAAQPPRRRAVKITSPIRTLILALLLPSISSSLGTILQRIGMLKGGSKVWRSVVGAMCWYVARDLASVGYAYLKVRRRRGRGVVGVDQ
ncbi:hypothetical protein SAICODRAFT_10421 [Saitoella complicata NRRL Y-17804]|uniref:RING-CH-type domain-containing protein n=1 Tax=Saitoella complicata (strain BCRC 22490 / CBS 7301 / JCM 7358 / NBRC 10748 / NRRL Y-17804) TaxID=698492 RepID=A0A0E9NCW8_SAICN|nr:uncharacterized protein SAICODRAFT_10421 [Saitoella complicata NRRL Y-17804]ODQ49893.1 hypothetical protein SAICODRAFT_10421 [Saitoella complicata NRRL Y-17804]GAO47684.1 hypothetical protein G7K_1883-t1 [Saitoella complicata NRRL Y-17804]